MTIYWQSLFRCQRSTWIKVSIACINKREKSGTEKLKNPKAFIDYSQTTDDVYKNLEDYDPTKKRKVSIIFDDMTGDRKGNKKLSPAVTEFFLRGGKLNISIVFISQSSFKVPKTIRVNGMHYFILKISNKRELQQTVSSNHSSDIEFNDFMKLYKNYTKEPFAFLVNNTYSFTIRYSQTCL